jgi:5'-methylthioadenosine phosphorylase
MEIPSCDYGLIGGSGTLSIEIPEQLNLDYVELLAKDLIFATPFGDSPPFKYINLWDKQGIKRAVLSCKMHGWRSGVSRADASRQVFWVFQKAGVKRVLAEGGVGAINYLLNVRDIIIPHDYIDFSLRKDVALGDRYLLIMRDAICEDMRKTLEQVAQENWEYRVFNRGVYVNTDGRHFESPAEVNCFKIAGGDVVGQSITPEVYLAREIGACYAGLYMVVNYAEGVMAPWQHEELSEIFYERSLKVGTILFNSLRAFAERKNCNCNLLRKDTLLKEIYK